MTKPLQLILIVIFVLTFGRTVLAYVAASSNYRLESDSINFGGSEESASTNYRLSDTFGELGTGTSTSASYNLHAGYRAMVGTSEEVYITLSVPGDIALSNLSADSGGTSSGEAAWQVITNNNSGYQLSIKAATSPALKYQTDGFSDYSPAGSVPDFAWSVGASQTAFGFTPEGDDIASRYLDNGSACGTGSGETSEHCWDGLSTSDRVVAQRLSNNDPAGSATTVKFKAQIGTGGTSLAAGAYAAAITATAAAL